MHGTALIPCWEVSSAHRSSIGFVEESEVYVARIFAPFAARSLAMAAPMPSEPGRSRYQFSNFFFLCEWLVELPFLTSRCTCDDCKLPLERTWDQFSG